MEKKHGQKKCPTSARMVLIQDVWCRDSSAVERKWIVIVVAVAVVVIIVEKRKRVLRSAKYSDLYI